MLETIMDILIDACADTAYLVPFLFVTYVLMEWLEHGAGAKQEQLIRRAGPTGPIFGALLGVIPQCGFSAMIATLYAGRVVTLGTLFAVFLSTSDEMLPLFVAANVGAGSLAKILAFKVGVGMLMGFVVDMAVRVARREADGFRIDVLCEQDGCHCEDGCDVCEHAKGCEFAEQGSAAHGSEVSAAHAQPCDCHVQGADACSLPDEAVRVHCHDHAHDHDHGHEHVSAVSPCGHDHTHDHDHAHPFGLILKSAFHHTLQVTLFVCIAMTMHTTTAMATSMLRRFPLAVMTTRTTTTTPIRSA